MVKNFWFLIFLFIGACSNKSVYNWERPYTGITQFSYDHKYCIHNADFFPWSLPSVGPNKFNLRADFEAKNGIWASYIPYEGATPILVRSVGSDKYVSSNSYRKCMHAMGYKQRDYDKASITNLKFY